MATTGTMEQPRVAVSLNERFFRHFQDEVIALQERINRLEDTAVVGGERTDAIEHCLAGINILSNEVQDASSYLPAYDQRAYAEAIKALTEKLQEVRSTVAPKAKFSFKTARKNPSAISLQEAATLASSRRGANSGALSSDPSSAASSISTTPFSVPATPAEPALKHEYQDGKHVEKEPAFPDGDDGAIHKPSFSGSTSVKISGHSGVHIILPASASQATSSGSLTSLRKCVVDMSKPTESGKSFAGLVIKNIQDSLIVCGHVDGPVHVTGVNNSVLLVACRQFRMHECHGTDVYLHCPSRPIIEDCKNVRFAPLPHTYVLESDQAGANQWDKVDDFKWLKAEHSPNWSVIPDEKRIAEKVWADIVPGGNGLALDDILIATVYGRSQARPANI